MVEVARRENPDYSFEVADVRALPLKDASMDGAVAWYSLMYLPPDQRRHAFSELARVVRPGGYLATAFKAGDDSLRRSGQSVVKDLAYDVYWHSPEEVQDRVREADVARGTSVDDHRAGPALGAPGSCRTLISS